MNATALIRPASGVTAASAPHDVGAIAFSESNAADPAFAVTLKDAGARPNRKAQTSKAAEAKGRGAGLPAAGNSQPLAAAATIRGEPQAVSSPIAGVVAQRSVANATRTGAGALATSDKLNEVGAADPGGAGAVPKLAKSALAGAQADRGAASADTVLTAGGSALSSSTTAPVHGATLASSGADSSGAAAVAVATSVGAFAANGAASATRVGASSVVDDTHAAEAAGRAAVDSGNDTYVVGAAASPSNASAAVATQAASATMVAPSADNASAALASFAASLGKSDAVAAAGSGAAGVVGATAIDGAPGGPAALSSAAMSLHTFGYTEKHARPDATSSLLGAGTSGMDATGTGAAGANAAGTGDVTALLTQSTTSSSASAADPTATPSLPVHASVDGTDFPQGLSERISYMVDNNLNGAKLQVNPSQLGPIEVRIAIQNGHAQVWMSTHSAVTRDALEASSAKLREMLGGQGFSQVSVDISQRSFQERSTHAQPYERIPAERGMRMAAAPAGAAFKASTSSGLDAYA